VILEDVARLLRHAAELPVLSPGTVEENDGERIMAWEDAARAIIRAAHDPETLQELVIEPGRIASKSVLRREAAQRGLMSISVDGYDADIAKARLEGKIEGLRWAAAILHVHDAQQIAHTEADRLEKEKP
jgi:hypothetical protein